MDDRNFYEDSERFSRRFNAALYVLAGAFITIIVAMVLLWPRPAAALTHTYDKDGWNFIEFYEESLICVPGFDAGEDMADAMFGGAEGEAWWVIHSAEGVVTTESHTFSLQIVLGNAPDPSDPGLTLMATHAVTPDGSICLTKIGQANSY